MKVLILSRYGRLGASSRLRAMQFVPVLEKRGFRCTLQPFFDDPALQQRYATGSYSASTVLRAYVSRLRALRQRKMFDLVWIEKEALPWLPASVERKLLEGVPYAMDFDDAIFHNYDLHRRRWVRRLLGDRIDRLMAGTSLVVAGNRYLAERAAKAGAPKVEVVPTVIDLERYPPVSLRREPDHIPRIVWVGSSTTTQYLQDLAAPLRMLSARHSFKLRVIGPGDIDMPGVDVERMDWTEESEVASIQQCDIGVMPLQDTPWELGKCGYKLIQYMACGLPVVASRVGANIDIVREGKNGFLASDAEEWIVLLERLLVDAPLRHRLGATGRQRVEQEFSLQSQAGRLAGLLKQAALR
ncbi:glycosyltransferase family 4 protein [Luteimonas sp. MHLX1A]|uniref:glycosyltransferase family 4 protein n=1 Tax=Alterluteimonas muca TaxID=2878684 RepID=UPI001E32615D|nr:glycosyltransferase family 4 protein [Luteimonas sp. MHLX1A]MCD9047151.1 glycosyltransferase family 4 protein [Luteimonas sp. MHLX1A]